MTGKQIRFHILTRVHEISARPRVESMVVFGVGIYAISNVLLTYYATKRPLLPPHSPSFVIPFRGSEVMFEVLSL